MVDGDEDLQKARSAELHVVNRAGTGGQDPSLTEDNMPGFKPQFTTIRGQDPSVTDDDRRPTEASKTRGRDPGISTTAGGQDPSLTLAGCKAQTCKLYM